MEPKLPSPDRGPESRPADSVSNGEALPLSFSPETDTLSLIEHRERQNQVAPSAESAHAPAVALPAPVITQVTDDTAVSQPQVQDDDMPTTANDDELIEKEWVDKAKKVIAETKDDPYRREQEVNKLQADYLFKRYGRKLGSPQ